MAFRVEISAEAELDSISILEWLIANHAGDAGFRWFWGLNEAIASLANFPERCPLAPEKFRFSFEVRQLLYGRKPTFIEYFSPSRMPLSMSFTYAMAGASI